MKKNMQPTVLVSRKTVHVRKPQKTVEVKDVASHANGVSNIDGPQMIKTTIDLQLKRIYVDNAVANFVSLSKLQDSKRKKLFDEEKTVFLQVNTIKIPKCPVKTLAINLKHSILPSCPEIVLITADLKNEKKNDYEKNVEYYRAKLNRFGIESVKDIVPFHQLNAQYTEFELQQRLMGLYDLFVCDSSITGKVMNKIGHMIHKRNKILKSVKLSLSNLKGTFDKLFLQSQMNIHPNGDTYCMPIGHTGMSQSDLVDNIMAAADELAAKLPGGFINIRSLFIKTALGKPVQFYMSCILPSIIKVPVVKTPKNKTNIAVTGELSTEMDRTVTVQPSGNVLIESEEGASEGKLVKNAPRTKAKAQKTNGKNKVTEEHSVVKPTKISVKKLDIAEKIATATKRKIEKNEYVSTKKTSTKKIKKSEEVPELAPESDVSVIAKKKAIKKDSSTAKIKTAALAIPEENGTEITKKTTKAKPISETVSETTETVSTKSKKITKTAKSRKTDTQETTENIVIGTASRREPSKRQRQRLSAPVASIPAVETKKVKRTAAKKAVD